MTSEIKVDTISEQTSANGVTIDGLTIKDGNIIGDVALAGTTPTFTIGDAGAEDAALIFDGNAQDFYIALDDSADDLLIGKGSTVGTTPAISIDENLQVKIVATTATTSTTTGSLIAAGGVGIAADLVVGDDIKLLSDAAVIHFGADSDVTLTHEHNLGLIIGGAAPTLTIGDAGAEDAKIVFDGNAQDFHIGLDDSVDDLIIGKGSALGTTPAITINEDLQTTIANHANPKSAFRNHVINGDFCVWQRTASATTISDGSNEGYNSADRWQMTFGSSAGGSVVWSRSQDVPAEQGFEYALKISPSATASASGAHEVRFSTTLEAQNFPDLSYGTSAAKNMVLSFWFKTNKVGLYSVYFEHPGTGTAKRKYVTFTPAQSDTWERIELLVTGDTDTAFPITSNVRGITVCWYLDNTPNFDSANAANDWGTAVLINSSNNVNFMDNTSNELYITGVQLEVADTATDFEYLPFDVVLNRCQRYLQQFGSNTISGVDVTAGGDRLATMMRGSNNDTTLYADIPLLVPLRNTPTVSFNAMNIRQDATNYDISSFDQVHNFGGIVYLAITASANLNEGLAAQLRFTGSGGYLRMDAEL